jgi:guanine deaminase
VTIRNAGGGGDRQPHLFCGTVVHCTGRKNLEILEKHVIGVDNLGRVAFVCPAASADIRATECGARMENPKCTKLGQNQLLMPGMVDTHIHAPQYAFTGTGYELPLLDWLNK